MWRRQLPAWSPLTVGAIAAGARASNAGGRHTTSLATRLRTEYGAAAVQLTDSGTVALALAMLAAAPEGTRPRVAMPAWGCYDLMTAADIADAEVILYDLDPATLSPATASFADALAQRPAAVVVGHWFGLPAPLAPLLAAAREAGAIFIEDAAQGVGGMIAGRPLGSVGDFGILSFGRGKGRTGGRGGARLATNPPAATLLLSVARRVAPARSGKGGLVALAAQWAAGRPWAYAIPSSIPALRLGETIYHPPTPIRGMPEWAAAVAGAMWNRSALESGDRRAAAARWAQAVANSTSVRVFNESSGTAAGWLRYPVLVNDPTALLDADARRLGIMPGYEGILADLPLEPGRLVNTGPWPGAEELASRLRTLPSHSLMRATDEAAIVQILERNEHRRT
jgi:dTDP-4-amino-4,6-dideoxygalactose transaminase